MQGFFEKLEERTKGWKIKQVLKPYYLPVLHWLKYKSENRNFRSNSMEVLFAADKALRSIGINYWLDFGTLLGVVRDGALIRHDTDIDVGVLIEDHSELIRKTLEEAGFRFQHEFQIEDGRYGREQSYAYKEVTFDIFYYGRDDTHMWCHLFPVEGENSRSILELKMNWTGFSTIRFSEHDWQVPGDPHQRLKDTYGEQYLVPDSSWNTLRDACNASVIDKPVKILY